LNTVPLGSASQINPKKPRDLDHDTLCSFVPMEYVDDHFGTITEAATRRVKQVEKGYTYFHNGDVLFAKITPCMENGKCAIARNLVNGIGFGSTEFHVVRPKHDVMPEWVFYFLRQHSTRQEAARHMTGTAGQQRVPTRFLQEVIIPLPPLPEQKRIAAILAKADRLRRLRRTAHDLSDTYLQSVFLEMFGKYLGGKGHPEFGDVLERPLQNGVFERNDKYGSGTPVVWVDNLYHTISIDTEGLRRATLDEKAIRKYEVIEGDLLFTRSSLVREGIGQINIVPELSERTTFECHIIRARVNREKVDPYYVLGLYRSAFGKREILKRSKTATMTTIGQDGVSSLPCPVPPLPLQQQFAHIVHQFERLRAQQREAQRQAEHLFQTLLHQAFRRP
jgi:type I restriction enzyme S subunit